MKEEKKWRVKLKNKINSKIILHKKKIKIIRIKSDMLKN
jgi:hypothetical protein